MHIFIRDGMGKTTTLEAEPTDALSNLQQKIQSISGLSPLQQRLLVNGKQWDDSSCPPPSEALVDVLSRLPGGAQQDHSVVEPPTPGEGELPHEHDLKSKDKSSPASTQINNNNNPNSNNNNNEELIKDIPQQNLDLKLDSSKLDTPIPQISLPAPAPIQSPSSTSLTSTSQGQSTSTSARPKKKSKKCTHCHAAPAVRIIGDCMHCEGHFCAKHRLMEDHACVGLGDCKAQSRERNKMKLESESVVAPKIGRV